MRLSGKVAIVTGATKGVGRGIAHRFAESGASVVIAGRSEERGKAVEKEIRDAGGQALFVPTDLCVENDCRNMVEKAEQHFGPLSTLVNNAAATHLVGTDHPHADKKMHEVANETMNLMWQSDLHGLFWSCRYAIRAILANGRKDGSIINISSGASNGGTDMAAYVASKAAMNGITHSMAGEYAKVPIRVNGIVLGLIKNGGNVELMLEDDTLTRMLQASIPLPLIGEADDIAWGSVYLASDEARYITGVLLPIDGGASGTISTPQHGDGAWGVTS